MPISKFQGIWSALSLEVETIIETDVKYLKSGALRTNNNIDRNILSMETENKNPFTGVFQRFCS